MSLTQPSLSFVSVNVFGVYNSGPWAVGRKRCGGVLSTALFADPHSAERYMTDTRASGIQVFRVVLNPILGTRCFRFISGSVSVPYYPGTARISSRWDDDTLEWLIRGVRARFDPAARRSVVDGALVLSRVYTTLEGEVHLMAVESCDGLSLECFSLGTLSSVDEPELFNLFLVSAAPPQL